jgi:two-component system invasion response regulator UvrY
MTEKKTITLLIADDHVIMRRGLKTIFGETKDIVVSGEAASGMEAIKQCRNHAFKVMLLDISLPDRNGIEVLKQIKKEHPELAVLMLSMHDEKLYAIRSIKAGASGYLSKQSTAHEIITAVRQVAAGQKYISASLAQELANHLGQDYDVPRHEALSDREYQTLTMIASGKTVTAIAKELSLSVKTISEYRSRLLVKMQLKNSAELTLYAIQNHLVE